jgi:hypothetical protein
LSWHTARDKFQMLRTADAQKYGEHSECMQK